MTRRNDGDDEPRSSGYFRAPLDTMNAIADANPAPEVLAAWLILRRFAFGKRRELTAAGAKKISGALGISRRKATKLLQALLAIRYGERGQYAALMTAADWNSLTGEKVPAMRANAAVYVTPNPGGEAAYLPDLLIPPGDNARCYFARLCDLEPEPASDALRLLVQLHYSISVADFFGADPETFAFRQWESSGRPELGWIGSGGRRHYWLVRESDSETAPPTAMQAVCGGVTDAHADRFWAALDVLIVHGLIFRAAVVFDARGRLRYPLWVFGKSHRQRLEKFGLICDLATRFQRDASSWKIDAAILQGVEAIYEGDTEVFICATDSNAPPTVRSIFLPTLIAPTPENTAGMATVRERCHKWAA